MTPWVLLFLTWLLAAMVELALLRLEPPVPTTNCRMPRAGSATPAGVCGAKRS